MIFKTTKEDILQEKIKEVSNGSMSLYNYIPQDNRYAISYYDDNTVYFTMDENFTITVLSGDRVKCGEFYELEVGDELLKEFADEVQKVLYAIREKNTILVHEGIKRVSIKTASEIIEHRKEQGKFYTYECNSKGKPMWIGIDNEDGNAWTEEFETLERCIGWLNGDVSLM